jgi:protoporphyrinogen oxidase
MVNMSEKKKAIIIGAGPAGLTAAFELLLRTDIQPIILEKSEYIGGISKTVQYKGNRIDIGGHRFFSKSDRVMEWWVKMLPIAAAPDSSFLISYQNKHREVNTSANMPPGSDPDKVMLVRERLSRIYYLKQFFDYPITLSADTIKKLGMVKMMKIGSSYIWSRISPIKNEKTLEDFFINRFGRELYHTFFKDYTEKVWGTSCKDISSEWGAQRIKKLTIGKAIIHAIKSQFKSKDKSDLAQKNTETSLIEQFLYPKLGPGQLWEEVARLVQEMGGIIHHYQQVTKITHSDNRITSVSATNTQTGQIETYNGSYFFSTMPIKELLTGWEPAAPKNVAEIAQGLLYRDFITVGLLLTELKVKDEKQANKLIKDNWIYIQEREVRIGRLQIFNNWSPYMVKDPNHVWIGLEYFCNVGDSLWSKPDAEFMKFAIDELAQIGIISKDKVIDSTILREEKTYPAYFGTYNRFDEVKEYVNHFSNLFLVGRNGMHKYNNSDHSMLTAMTAVDNIIAGKTEKENIWQINTEQEYHEKK